MGSTGNARIQDSAVGWSACPGLHLGLTYETRSGVFSRHGISVFGPERTILLCRWRAVPNSSFARSRIPPLTARSPSPGATSPHLELYEDPFRLRPGFP